MAEVPHDPYPAMLMIFQQRVVRVLEAAHIERGHRGVAPWRPSHTESVRMTAITTSGSCTSLMTLQAYKYPLASLLLILVTASPAKQTGSALEQFQRLQVRLRESHTAKDWHSNPASANELKELLNEAPDSLLEVARADVHVGDLDAAFRELEAVHPYGSVHGLARNVFRLCRTP